MQCKVTKPTITLLILQITPLQMSSYPCAVSIQSAPVLLDTQSNLRKVQIYWKKSSHSNFHSDRTILRPTRAYVLRCTSVGGGEEEEELCGAPPSGRVQGAVKIF